MGKDRRHSVENLTRFAGALRPRLLYQKPVFSKNPRSSLWRAVRKTHLKEFNACLACGGRVSLEVHHLMPYHQYPELELDKNNLITLCDSKSRCHWIIGHLLNWRSYNPHAKADALIFREKILSRPAV